MNLGEILMGERDELTGFDINFLAPEPCKVQCTQQLTSKQLKAFRDKINDDYFASMADSSGWLTQSIGAYRAQRDRVRA